MTTINCTTTTAPFARTDRVGLVLSATSYGVDGEVRSIQRPRVPNYAVRRFVAASLAVFAVALGAAAIVGAVTGFDSSPVTAADIEMAAAVGAPTAHVVDNADTMWSIASTYRGDVAHDRYLEALIRRNGGTDIEVGQVVWLP